MSFIPKRVSIITTLNCTLNCKLCNVAIPRFKERKISYNATTEQLITCIDVLFDIYDHIRLLDFVGGEPLLWGNSNGGLAEMLNYLSKYKDRFDLIRIVTNGTIIPSDDLILVIKSLEYKFDFMLSNYGILSLKADKLKSVLNQNNIDYNEVIYHGDNQFCDGWVDTVGDLTYKDYQKDEIRRIYDNCYAGHTCAPVFDGKLYPCPQAMIVEKLCGIKDNDLIVPLLDSSITLESKKITAERFGKYMPIACSYCNGFDTVNSKRYPAAEQI